MFSTGANLSYFHRFTRRFFVLLSLWLIIGPTAILQIAAWSFMIASYSAEDGIAEGVSKTFSGQEPCHLCNLVQEIDQSDPDHPKTNFPETREIKILPRPEVPDSVHAPRQVFVGIRALVCFGQSRFSEVPKPPPRSV